MDLMQGGILIALSNVQTGNVFASPNTLLGQVTNTAVLVVGMSISGAGLNAGNTTVISRIINSTCIEMSEPAPAAAQNPYTFAGDVLNVGLIKFAPTNSYDRNTACFANVQGDEVSGTGYTANGLALVVTAPGAGRGVDVLDSNTSITNFTNPSWTSATIDAAGMVIYSRGIINSSPSTPQNRIGFTASGASVNSSSIGLANCGGNATAEHTVSLHDFGGEQKVTAGTFTVVMPTANGTASILRLA